jgi:hypothetical protein
MSARPKDTYLRRWQRRSTCGPALSRITAKAAGTSSDGHTSVPSKDQAPAAALPRAANDPSCWRSSPQAKVDGATITRYRRAGDRDLADALAERDEVVRRLIREINGFKA